MPIGLQRLVYASALRLALRLVGLAALVGTILVATFGSETSATNPAPTRLFVWLWVGIVPLSLR
jgi:hypothetical protein